MENQTNISNTNKLTTPNRPFLIRVFDKDNNIQGIVSKRTLLNSRLRVTKSKKKYLTFVAKDEGDGIKFNVQGKSLGHACFQGIVTLGGMHSKWTIGWDSNYSRYKLISTYDDISNHNCSFVLKGELCFGKARWTTNRYLFARNSSKIGGGYHAMTIEFLDAQTHKPLNLRNQD